MKKFLALLLAVMMLSVSAFAMAEEAGFDEFELGVEGEQTVDFMTMAMVYFQPVDMAPAENATPREGSDLHIEVDLTAKEFDVIEFLMRNPNRVYSREALLDTIWAYEYRSDIRTVDVHIRRLREKLEKISEINTVIEDMEKLINEEKSNLE